jgi:hypothetical protein
VRSVAGVPETVKWHKKDRAKESMGPKIINTTLQHRATEGQPRAAQIGEVGAMLAATPWMGDQPVVMPLRTHRPSQTHNKRTKTPMSRVGLEPTVPSVGEDEENSCLRPCVHPDRRCTCLLLWSCINTMHYIHSV